MGLSLRAGRPAGPRPTDPWPQWSYAGFGVFRRALAEHIGVDLAQMQRFGGSTGWDTVASPLRHLLDHADDCGELTIGQVRELAPALREAVSSLARQDADGLLWSLDSSNGRAAHDLVALLELCVAEDLPVHF
ncbi:hypothetical protein [Streptomyces sp. NPDC058268]|uniref:hypothetical protein n=1 Tax=Streptomyces sp. NPDC058268 TaxID=3346413 RepID=UPI0036E77A10